VATRWNNPDYLLELADTEGAPEVIPFWRTPVFKIKLYRVPAFLLPRLAEMAQEVPATDLGKRIYHERINCLLALASAARDTDPAGFSITGPPTDAERRLGAVLGQAFHQGCSLADIAFATRLPSDRVLAIGKRTIVGGEWLSRITDPKPE
jgi:hypothetical protein